MNTLLVSIVVPVYNEQDVIPEFYKQLYDIIKQLNYEIIFVHDESTDNTLEKLKQIADQNSRVVILNMSRRFGHQNSLFAGYEYCRGDIIICMDSDLQHPPSLIPALIEQYKKGYDIVNTERREADKTGLLTAITSKYFYTIFNKLSGLHLNQNSADFRLLSRKALDELLKMNEKTIFLRGMVEWIGFKPACVKYQAMQRPAGVTKYNLKKRLNFAADGILSFSAKPLKISIYVGVVISLLSFLYGAFAFLAYFIKDQVVSGWASLLIMVSFLGGLNLIFLGIIGEYIARIYEETKSRPKYIIKNCYTKND